MKKILILGGGRAQLGLIKTAKSLGYYVITVGLKGEYPGYKLSDKCYYVDIYDKKAVLSIAMSESIDGISMVCSDFGIETLGYVCDRLNLNGLTEDASKICSNKLLMKEKLKRANVNTANYRIITSNESALKAANELSFPLIVKAVDLQGSRGIYYCPGVSDLMHFYSKAIQESKEDYCLVEEFIDGEEFGAQGFVSDGKLLFLQTHGDIVLKKGFSSIPVGHYMPYISADKEKIVAEIVEKSILALGLNNCAVNVDFIQKDGTIYVIELTGRAGANSLPELTSEYLGINYYEVILKSALKLPIKAFAHKYDEDKCVLSQQLFSDQTGSVKQMGYKIGSEVVDFEPFVNLGDQVNKFTNSRDCIGRVIIKGHNLEECKSSLGTFLDDFHITLA